MLSTKVTIVIRSDHAVDPGGDPKLHKKGENMRLNPQGFTNQQPPGPLPPFLNPVFFPVMLMRQYSYALVSPALIS